MCVNACAHVVNDKKYKKKYDAQHNPRPINAFVAAMFHRYTHGERERARMKTN